MVRTKATENVDASRRRTPTNQTVLGLDPGFGRLGYAVLGGSRSAPKIITFGCIETSAKLPHGERLAKIAREVAALVKAYKPTVVAIERLFFSKNVKTALQVAEARGVILLTLAHSHITPLEFSPQEVKSTATNDATADKAQVQKMLKLMFKLKETPQPDDAADAVAIALCGLTHNPKP